MNFCEGRKKEAVAGLRKINARAGEEASVQCSDDGDKYDERNELASGWSEHSFRRGSTHVIAGRDFRNRQYAQIGDVSQQVDCDACAQSEDEREEYVALRIFDFTGDETDVYP